MALVFPGLFTDPEVGASNLAFAQGASGFLGGLQQGLDLGERLAASFERGRSRTEQERARRLAEAQRAQAIAGAAVPESDLAQALRAALLGGGLGSGRAGAGGGRRAGGGGTSILGLPPEVGDVGQVAGRAQAEFEERGEAQQEARQLEEALAAIEEELLLTQGPDLPGLARAEEVTGRREAIRQETGGELSGTDPLEQAVGLAATQLGERRRLETALAAAQGPARAAQERAAAAPEGLRNPAVEFGLPPTALLDPAAVGQAVAIFEATGDPAALREIGGEVPRDLRGLQARIRTFNDTIRARQFRELAPALAAPQEQEFSADDLVARTTFALGELAPEDDEELRAAAQAHIDAGGSLAEWDRLIGSRERITRESVRSARQRSLADQRIAAARAQADRAFGQRAALQGASRELQAEQAEVQGHLRLAEAYNAVTFSATGTARTEAEAARDRELEAAGRLIPGLGPSDDPGSAPPAAQAVGGLPVVSTQAEYDALPRGATFIDASDGNSRKRKP